VIFAIGDDDAHSFKPQDDDAFELTRPGRSWIMVRADYADGAGDPWRNSAR
jgi:hypothetical protein